MKKQKICEYCKKLYSIPKNVSLTSWNARKFCTKKCKTMASRGKPSWNAGKCPPYKITPAYRKKMQKIALSKGYGKWMTGRKMSPKSIEKLKLRKGKNHPMWKGGKHIGSDGYFLIYSPDHPHKDRRNNVREHRLVAEKLLGRYLTSTEVIHHINEITKDNRPENLYLFASEKEHRSYHGTKNKQPLKSNLGKV